MPRVHAMLRRERRYTRAHPHWRHNNGCGAGCCEEASAAECATLAPLPSEARARPPHRHWPRRTRFTNRGPRWIPGQSHGSGRRAKARRKRRRKRFLLRCGTTGQVGSDSPFGSLHRGGPSWRHAHGCGMQMRKQCVGQGPQHGERSMGCDAAHGHCTRAQQRAESGFSIRVLHQTAGMMRLSIIMWCETNTPSSRGNALGALARFGTWLCRHEPEPAPLPTHRIRE